MATTPIRWLHLSDFHVGKNSYAHRQLFEYILKHVERKKSEEDFVPDFIFITGDLANWGLESEYKIFWEEFAQPLQQLIGGDITLRTFVVPGNHDVNRKKNSAFDRGEIAREADYFHADVNGHELRSILLPRFEAFRAADQTLDQGAMFSDAGAFGRLVSRHGYQIGVAGINTAWLCKDEQDKEKLTPGKALLEKALAQISTADLRIVLGHHPIDWLLPDQQRSTKALLGKPGVVYLHGHLHEQWTEPTHGGGGQFLAIQTGAAFQAEEHEVWRNGLLWGEADLVEHKLRLQPYEWSKDHQDWGLKGDAFHPTYRDKQRPDWWTYDLPGKTASRPTPPLELPPALAIPDPTRPVITPLPPDTWANIGQRFIGRGLSLSDVAEAVAGLRARAVGAAPPHGAQAVKLVWVHGFGGMGKSWFLHRARQQAETDELVHALIVEWDVPERREPLNSEPRLPKHVFEVLAYRLAQNLKLAAEPYWQANEQVLAAEPERLRLRNQFGEELRAAAEGKPVSQETRHLLHEEKVWDDDLTRRQQNLERWHDQPSRYEQTFADWCQKGAHCTNPAVLKPHELLADGLRTALRHAAARYPLLLLLDTGEVLSEELDFWLRRLLAPLLRDETPLLVLVGNRRRPDVDQPGGSREGWLPELRDRLREIDFAEAKRFTVEEIEQALVGLRPSLAMDCGVLAESLHRFTLGVPLAVRTILDLHERGNEDLLPTLAADTDAESYSLTESQAVQQVIETMVDRLLYHLVHRPHSADDLCDIVALALLQRAETKLLQALWYTDAAGVRTRLQQMGNRYALLSGGDMHATVRAYLRRHWHQEVNRLADFGDTLARLQAAADTLPDFSVGSSEYISRALLQLNLRMWREPVTTMLPALAQLLTVALAYDVDTEGIKALLQELPLPGAARKLWQVSTKQSLQEVVKWLQYMPTAGWPALEQGCLTLIGGLVLMDSNWWELPLDAALAAFPLLESATTSIGLTRLPQPDAVGQAYFRIARILQNEEGSTKWLEVIEKAYKQAIAFKVETAASYHNLGNLLAESPGRALEAEEHYHSALALDSKNIATHNNLGNLLSRQLGRQTVAEEHYRRALEFDLQHAVVHRNLGNLLANQQGRAAAAEEHYRKALKFAPTSYTYYELAYLLSYQEGQEAIAEEYFRKALAYNHKFVLAYLGLGHLLSCQLGRAVAAEACFYKALEFDPKSVTAHSGLGHLLANQPERVVAAEMYFRKAFELDSLDSSTNRGLAWLALIGNPDLPAARTHIAKAQETDTSSSSMLLAEAGLETWEVGWTTSHQKLVKYLQSISCRILLYPYDYRLIALFRKIREQGGGAELVDTLHTVSDNSRPWWQPWYETVAALATGQGIDSCTTKQACIIYQRLSE